jgi:tetratricopeptide (TPR) repeat protein
LVNALEVTTVKVTHRFAISALGLAATAALVAVPSVAQAQMRQGPGPDTKRVVVTAFRGDPEAGVKLAEEIRKRITSDFSIRTLMPVSKKDIDNTLVSSGYKPDSALSPNDVKELSKLVRGDEVIDGTVRKSANGYTVNARLFLPRDVALSQPLIRTEGNNLGDIAKQIVHEFDQARKQIPANQDCENQLRAQKLDAAIAAARKGIQSYPKATIARLCLASAYQAFKSTPDSATRHWQDSVLAITKAIDAIDNASLLSSKLQYDVYKSRNDTANAMKALVAMMNNDPQNSTLRESVIAELVNSGKAEAAVPLVKQLVQDNPGDPQFMRTYWLVLRAAKHYKEAVAAGEAYVQADPTAADTAYYYRQINDLGEDSAFAKAAEMAATAIAKYPKATDLYMLKAQSELKAGQLPAAQESLRRALALDPNAKNANMLRAQIFVGMNQVDSAVAAVKADVAADANNKERDAQYMLGLASTSYRAAAASKKPEDFQKAMQLAQGSDEMNPSPQAKFIAAVAAWQQLAVSLQQGKNWKCADVQAASNNLNVVSTLMPGGGSVDAATAGQIMNAVPQAQQYVDAQNKRLCK